MLEFKKEYFQTETNRHLYPTTLDISKCEVYGCKEREAFMYKIPNNYYTSNAGNIDFSLYPNGVWSDYTAIKIVEKLPYFQPSVNFNKLGDITASNLNKLKDEIKQHIVDIETAITESYVFIDSGNAGQNNIPYLPNDCVWFRNGATGNIEALPVGELYDRFEQMLDKLYNEIKKLLLIDKENMKEELKQLTAELKKALEDLKANLEAKFKEEAEKYTAEKKEELDKHVHSVNKSELQKFVEQKKEELLHYITINSDKLKGEKGDRGASITKIVHKETASNGSNVYTVITDEDVAIGDITAPIGPHGDSIVGPKGDTGEKGDTGASIKNVGFVETVSTGNKYNVNLDNGSSAGSFIAPIGPKGDKGDTGEKGEKGDQGNTGITVPIQGQYALEVEPNGDLYVVYPDGTTPPTFTLESNGDLFLEIN